MKKPFEWSKLLTVFGVLVITWAIITGIWMLIRLLKAEAYDQSVTLYLGIIGIVTIICSVIFGFYFWKSKAENLVKIAKDLKANGVSDEVASGVVNTNQIGGT